MIDLAHIHPMIVHFPLALLPVAIVVMVLAWFKEGALSGRSCLQVCSVTLTVLSALGAIVAAVFGDMAAEAALSAGFAESAIELHEVLGVTTAVSVSVLALGHLWLCWKRPAGALPNGAVVLGGAAALVLILVTAYYGGSLVYGTGVNVQPVVANMQ